MVSRKSDKVTHATTTWKMQLYCIFFTWCRRAELNCWRNAPAPNPKDWYGVKFSVRSLSRINFWCRRAESDCQRKDFQSFALPLSYFGSNQKFVRDSTDACPVVKCEAFVLQGATSAFLFFPLVWMLLDSNQWPLLCKRSALANWAKHPIENF